MSEGYEGPVYRCPWCTLVYTDPHERDRCRCPSRKFTCTECGRDDWPSAKAAGACCTYDDD